MKHSFSSGETLPRFLSHYLLYFLLGAAGITGVFNMVNPLSLRAEESPKKEEKMATVENTATNLPTTGDEVYLLPEVLIAGDNKASLVIRDFHQAQKTVDQTAGAVAVVNSDSYKTGRAATLKDALTWAPGVYVQPRFGQEEARVSIRGSGIQRGICGGSGIMLLQDGMPVNVSDGSFNMQSIEPLATQYIDVYRGANSLQYGSTMLGGAMNFVSYTGYNASPLLMRFEGGSFNTFREQISSGMAYDNKYDDYISITGSSTDAYRDHSRQANFRLFSNLGAKITPELESRLYVAYVDTKSQLPGPLQKSTAYDSPRSAFPINNNNNWQKNYSFLRLGNKTAWERDDNRLEGQFFWDQVHLYDAMSVLTQDLNNDLGGMLQWQNKYPLWNHDNKLTLGFNPSYGFTTDLTYGNNYGQADGELSNNEQYSLNLNSFAQDQFHLLEKLSLVLGSAVTYASRQNVDRWSKQVPVNQAAVDVEEMGDMEMMDHMKGMKMDHMKGMEGMDHMGEMHHMEHGEHNSMSGMKMSSSQHTRAKTTQPTMDMSCCGMSATAKEIRDHSGTQDYWGWSPQVGLLYDVTPHSQVYGNVSRSFAPPSFEQLVNQNYSGILPLKAQTATTLETGTRGRESRFSWDLAYYYSWVDNEFFPYSINTPTGPSTITVNEAHTIHQGVEAALDTTLWQRIFCGIIPKRGYRNSWNFPENGCDRISWKQIGLFNDFHFSNDPDFGNNSLPGIPKLYYRTELLYEHPKGFYCGPNLEWVPISYDVDSANTLAVTPYAILGLKAGYRPKKGPSVYIEAMNLCNTTYVATTGVIPNANAPLANTAQFFPGDGAAVYAGLQYSF